MKPLTPVYLLFPLVFLAVAIGCKDSKVKVKMDWEKQTISIVASNQPLSEVLRQIQDQGGITVQIEDFEEKQVSVSIKNKPIDAALLELIGSGKRYFFDTGSRELAINGKKGPKEGKKPTGKEGLTAKSQFDDTSFVEPIDIPPGNTKSKVEDITMVESDGLNGTKRAANEIATVPGTVPAKKEKGAAQPQENEKYLRLRFRMEGGAITIEKALIFSGELTVPPAIVSDYVYTVELDGKIIALGSFLDPLEMHSYYPDPNKQHESLKAKVGHFNISIPGKVANPARLKSLALQFYRVEGAIQPPILEVENFGEIQGSLKSVSRSVLSNQEFPVEDLSRQ